MLGGAGRVGHPPPPYDGANTIISCVDLLQLHSKFNPKGQSLITVPLAMERITATSWSFAGTITPSAYHNSLDVCGITVGDNQPTNQPTSHSMAWLGLACLGLPRLASACLLFLLPPSSTFLVGSSCSVRNLNCDAPIIVPPKPTLCTACSGLTWNCTNTSALVCGCAVGSCRTTGTMAPNCGTCNTMVNVPWSNANTASIEFCEDDNKNFGYRLPGEVSCLLAKLVVRVSPGQNYRLTIINNATQTTNLHTHGLHISGNGNADNPARQVSSGQCLTYHWDIPANHMGGTHWMHSHDMTYGLIQVRVYVRCIEETPIQCFSV